jgi:hypothetical protein
MNRRILLAPLLLLLITAYLNANVVCYTDAGYEIRYDYRYLPDDPFTEESLRSFFQPYIDLPLTGEIYVIATNDSAAFEDMSRPKLVLVPHGESGIKPVWTDKQLAYFFRVGKNAFFQFKDRDNQVRWVVLAGENLFERRFNQNEIKFIGQNFIRSEELKCSDINRRLVFVSPELNRDELFSIIHFYDKFFPDPARFTIDIYESIPSAIGWKDIRFPSLDVLGIAYRKEELGLKRVSTYAYRYNYSRTSPTFKQLQIYEKGRRVFSRRLE